VTKATQDIKMHKTEIRPTIVIPKVIFLPGVCLVDCQT
jgi:hypothetical protein